MNKKIIIPSIIFLVALAGIFSYLYIQNNSKNLNNQNFSFDSVEQSNNQFAFDLYSKYKSQEDNIFFSPYSISSALAIAYEGARGQTAEEIKNVFYFSNNSEIMHAGFLSINNKMNDKNNQYNLSVANALWVQKDYNLLQEYTNNSEKYYGGKVINLDFVRETEKSRITINGWVENKTNNKIKDLIPQGQISTSTKLIITNAVYFKANWSQRFLAEETKDREFNINSEEKKTVPTMYQKNNFNYFEDNNLQILEMDYLGNNLSMLIILPKDNLESINKELTNENLNSWKKAIKNEKVAVYLPKFKFETYYFMDEYLKEMGMPIAFSDNANFSGIDGTRNLTISQVIHKTFVEVAEYGTEAAAATAVIIKDGALPTDKEYPKLFKADHPFIFIIQQKDSGNILFLGRVNNPKS